MHRNGDDAAHDRVKSRIIFFLLIKLEIFIPKDMWHKIHPYSCCSSFENPRMKPFNMLVKQVDEFQKKSGLKSKGFTKGALKLLRKREINNFREINPSLLIKSPVARDRSSCL